MEVMVTHFKICFGKNLKGTGKVNEAEGSS
jgi:hypothetical protein